MILTTMFYKQATQTSISMDRRTLLSEFKEAVIKLGHSFEPDNWKRTLNSIYEAV